MLTISFKVLLKLEVGVFAYYRYLVNEMVLENCHYYHKDNQNIGTNTVCFGLLL